MGATFLLPVFEITYLLCLAIWVGGMLLIRGAVLPLASTTTSDSSRFEAIASWLNRYYLWITVAIGVALPAAVGRPLSFPELRGPLVAVQAGVLLVAIVLAITAASQVLASGRAGSPTALDADAITQFRRVVRRTGLMDAISVLLGVGLLVAFVLKDAPRSAGIVEPTPEQRYETNLQILQEIEGYLLEKKARTERRNRLSPFAAPAPSSAPDAAPPKAADTSVPPGG